MDARLRWACGRSPPRPIRLDFTVTARRRTWEILQPTGPGDWASRTFDAFILTLIVLNVLAILLESIPTIYRRVHPAFFFWFEVVSVAIFTFEYLLRVWSCVESPRFQPSLPGRLRFMATPMAIVDLLAILPFYLPFVGVDLRVLRSLRLFRLFRLAKLERYIGAVHTLGQVVWQRRADLLLVLLILSLLLVLSGTLMYYAESTAQPEAFGSIPAAIWWSLTAFTPIGSKAGPVTVLGKFIASAFAVLGLAMFALPTAILGAAFVRELQKEQPPPPERCPHCGRRIDAAG